MSAPPPSEPSEPSILVESREMLFYLLAEAAEIEHGLMCCYLFAAFTLKRDEAELSGPEKAAIERWRRSILSVARDEMVHLALANNLLAALGSGPHFGRQNFPVSSGYHPSGVVVRLEPFTATTVDHFVFLERPEGTELPDGAGFVPASYVRGQLPGRLVPTAQDYRTVGHLYRGLRTGLETLSKLRGEAALFCGDPALQLGPESISLAGMQKVTSLASALSAIDTIVHQGEGAPDASHEQSHYAKFVAIRDELAALTRANPSFVPGRPVAHNPVMRRPPEPEGKVWVSAEPAATLLDRCNAAYGLMLRALATAYSPLARDAQLQARLVDTAINLMFRLGPTAEQLAQLPASPDHPGVTAGMTFTMSRSLHPLTSVAAAESFFAAAQALIDGKA